MATSDVAFFIVHNFSANYLHVLKKLYIFASSHLWNGEISANGAIPYFIN
jgi:hypothetical protein